MNYEYLPLLLVPIWTFLTNGIVLITFCCERNLRNNIANLTIASLTIADFLLAIIVLPFAVYFKINDGWDLGFVWHLIWFCCDVFLSSSSIMNLCVISVYRYLAIAYPYRISHTISVKHVCWLLLLAWGLSFLVSLLLLIETLSYDFNYVFHSFLNHSFCSNITTNTDSNTNNNTKNNDNINRKQSYMMGDKPFLIYGSILTFYLPLSLMSFTGARSIQILRRQRTLQAGLHQVINFGLKPAKFLAQTTSNKTPNTNTANFPEDLPLNSIEKPDKTELSNFDQFKSRTSKIFNNFLPIQLISQRKSHDDDSNPNMLRTNILFISTKEKRAIRTLLIVLIFFVVCWLPFFTLQIVIAFAPTHWNINDDLLFDLAWPGYISSGINPVIYAVFHPEYKDAIKRFLKRCF